MPKPEAIARGVELADQVLMWVLFYGEHDLKYGEARAAIITLFGPEVDDALAAKYAEAAGRQTGLPARATDSREGT